MANIIHSINARIHNGVIFSLRSAGERSPALALILDSDDQGCRLDKGLLRFVIDFGVRGIFLDRFDGVQSGTLLLVALAAEHRLTIGSFETKTELVGFILENFEFIGHEGSPLSTSGPLD
jgi:hypothetical protein